MNPSRKPGALPLDYAAEIAFEMHLLRGECSEAARDVICQCPLDETALDEYAQLDDALAQAYRLLHAAIAQIYGVRAKRRPRPR